jgi:hypothetical protein
MNPDLRFHDAEARDRAKSKHHPLLTRKDPFFNARRFRDIVATSALGRAMDLQPISCFPVLGVFIDARVRVFFAAWIDAFFPFVFRFGVCDDPDRALVVNYDITHTIVTKQFG